MKANLFYLNLPFPSFHEVDSWVDWVFSEHADSDLVRQFFATLRACYRRSDYHAGIPVGSMCSGWGVAEMVFDALNDWIDEFGDGDLAKVMVA